MTKKICSSINELPDDLILKILSFLSTKHSVVTSLLSKKWKSLWTRRPILKYDVRDHIRFELFIDKSLFSHQSHVLESLHVKLSVFRWNKVIGPWIRTALHHHHHCHLRELEIDACLVHTLSPPQLFTCKTLVVLKLEGTVIDVEAPLTTVCLPSLKTLHIDHSSLFDFGSLQMLLSNCNCLTDLMVIRESRLFFSEFDVSWCKTLVALKLEGLKDVISISSSAVCLPFLKTLHVARMLDFDNDSFCLLLSNCPVLSDLTLEEKTSHVMLNLDIAMPYLQRLSTHLCSLLKNYIRKLAIIAPSFKYFSIQELLYARYLCIVRIRLGDPSKLEDASIFGRTVHLELSICSERSGEILVDLLICSIKLLVLNLKNVYLLTPLDSWEPPSLVPKCLLSSLEALEWRGYTGRDGDKDLMSYLLNHALCFKTAKIFYESYPHDVEEKQQTEEDLASMPRGSNSCEIVVNEFISTISTC